MTIKKNTRYQFLLDDPCLLYLFQRLPNLCIHESRAGVSNHTSSLTSVDSLKRMEGFEIYARSVSVSIPSTQLDVNYTRVRNFIDILAGKMASLVERWSDPLELALLSCNAASATSTMDTHDAKSYLITRLAAQVQSKELFCCKMLLVYT
jgi:hypothetical protein